MRYLALVLIALLTACNSTGEQDGSETIKSISGEWVREGYRDKVILYQSPMKAGAEALVGNSGVVVGELKDSAFVLVLINNHEGFTGSLKPSVIGKNGGVIINTDFPEMPTMELSLEKNKDGNTLILSTFDLSGNLISTDRFERVADFKDINDPCGLAAIQILLEDRWSVVDAQQNPIADIEVDSYGDIIGWDGYKTIIIATDAVFGGEDMIRLSTGNHRADWNMIADFKGDRIELFEAIDSDESPVSTRGELLFTFHRDNIGK